MGWKPDHRRVKPKYNPQPNKRERLHKGRVKALPCFGCGTVGANEAHHILLDAPGKRWRRDHRFIVPLCNECHRGPKGVHGLGSEAEWCAANDRDTVAEARRLEAESVSMGILPERREAA